MNWYLQSFDNLATLEMIMDVYIGYMHIYTCILFSQMVSWFMQLLDNKTILVYIFSEYITFIMECGIYEHLFQNGFTVFIYMGYLKSCY